MSRRSRSSSHDSCRRSCAGPTVGCPEWVRTAADTADIVQDVLLQTFRRIDRFEPRGHRALQGYLRRSIQNRITDEIRRGMRVVIEDGDAAARAAVVEPFSTGSRHAAAGSRPLSRCVSTSSASRTACSSLVGSTWATATSNSRLSPGESRRTPRAWPCAVRSSVWPRRWAVSEPNPLIHRAAEAVADGIAIDWDAAVLRLSPPHRTGASRRTSATSARFAQPPSYTPPRPRAASAGTRGSAFVSLIAAVATAADRRRAHRIRCRTRTTASQIPAIWQILLLTVFATVGLGLVIGGRQDRRAMLLGAFYLVVATSFAQRFIGRIAGSPRPVWASLFLEALSPYLLVAIRSGLSARRAVQP